jgi:hypothetical protein
MSGLTHVMEALPGDDRGKHAGVVAQAEGVGLGLGVGVGERRKTSRSSLALSNLRGMVIVVVLAFHSVLAYLASLGTPTLGTVSRFDDPPYLWRAFPIVDSHRWLGFDIFCAWQDVYLMSLMFFLSALFTWSSLKRKGTWKFLADRFRRLGIPIVVAVTIVMPIALYPVYRVTATDPGLLAYARHYLALPFWPCGPMWFLWELLALTIVGAGVLHVAPRSIEVLSTLASSARLRPGRFFLGLVTACALAYVPLAIAFTPMAWFNSGLIAFQLSRPLLYGVFYFAGLGIGAYGLERGLLAPDGMLMRRWTRWLAGATMAFVLWMGLTGLSMRYGASAPLALQLAVDLSFAVACATGCFGAIAACLRFATMRSRMLDSLADNAFGMYLLHYVFVVWLQYAMLGTALFVIAKAGMVFGGTLVLAWGTAVALRLFPLGARLTGADRILLPKPILAPGVLAGGRAALRGFVTAHRKPQPPTLAH